MFINSENINNALSHLNGLMSNTRKEYHLTLGQLINKLSIQTVSSDFVIAEKDINKDNYTVGYLYEFVSYRGYYEDLALERIKFLSGETAESLLDSAKLALGKTFTGYKGGDYIMTESTPLWITNHYSECGVAIVGVEVNIDSKRFTLITKDIDDE